MIWSREDDIALRQVPPDDGAPYRGRVRCRRQADRLAPSRGRRVRVRATGEPRAVNTPPGAARSTASSCSRRRWRNIRSRTSLLNTSCSRTGARLSTLRGVGVGHNAFAIESFLDELAKELGRDPLAFRLEISRGPAARADLLRTVADMSDWTRKRDGTALGVAVQEKDETLCGWRRRGLGRPRERQDQGAQFLGRDRRRPRGAAAQSRGADRRQHRVGPRPCPARKDHDQGRPRAADELHRLRGAAHVGRAEYRGQGDLHRQSADRRGRGWGAAGRRARSATRSPR